MNWRLVIIVWVAALAGLALCWSIGRPASGAEGFRADGSATGRATARPLLAESDLPVQRVDHIRITRADGAPMVLERDGDAWMQVEPFPYPIDPFSARQVVSAALQLAVSRVIDGDDLTATTLSSLALEPPEATVEFEWDGGRRRIDLGRLGVAGRAFVRVDGAERVDVVGQQLHQRLVGMDPREWRLRRLLPDAGADTLRVEISAGAARTVLERSGRRWSMTEPVATRVDATALEAFLRGIATSQSSGFLADQPDALGTFGLDQPAGALTIVMPDGQGGERRETLLVGAPIGVGGADRYGMVDGRPTVVRLAASTLAALFPSPAILIDPTASGVRPEDVREIRVKGPTSDFVIERDLDVWRSPDFDHREVPVNLVNDLLERLTSARAGSIAIREYPDELEVGFVTLIGFDRRPLATVRAARDPANGNWALNNGDGVLRLFPAGFAPPLTPDLFGLAAPEG